MAVLLLLLSIVVGARYRQRTRSSGVSNEVDVAPAKVTEASFTSEPLPATAAAKLVGMERGVTQAEVYDALGRPYRHEFLVRREGKLYQAVSYAFGDAWDSSSNRFYLLFEDERLTKVIQSPPFAARREPHPHRKGDFAVVRYALDPFERVAEVLSAEDLSGAELDAAIKRGLPKPDKDSNLGAVPYVLAPLIAAMDPIAREDRERVRRLEAHFDPSRISLGMTESEVEAVYGSHIGETMESELSCRAYGKRIPENYAPVYRCSWVVVCFDRGRAEAIFTDHFVDERQFPAAAKRPANDGGSGS